MADNLAFRRRVTIERNLLQTGIYTVDQAARIARVSSRKVRGWLDGLNTRPPALRRDMPGDASHLLSFVDLVQVMAVRALRADKRVSLPKIHDAVEAAAARNIHFPFARRHTTYLFGDTIVLELPEVGLIEATRKSHSQMLSRKLVELYLEDLAFDAEGLANSYRPASLRRDQRYVDITPNAHYGAPHVVPCDFTVAALAQAVQTEGSVEAAADAYEVERDDVLLALRFEDLVSGVAA